MRDLIGCLILAVYLLVGCVAVGALFPQRGVLWRGWFGCAVGLLLFMWLPALFAFALDYTMSAQWAALGVTAVVGVFSGVKLLIDGRNNKLSGRLGSSNRADEPIRAFAILVPVLTLIAAYLQYTHTLRPVGDSLHVGQSTYGDLSLHLSIATSLRNASFPPEYALLPGTRLAYPFLVDTLSTSLMLWGLPLRWAFIIPSTLMCAVVFTGILLLAWQVTHSEKLAALALLLMVFCGGFGFLYSWDRIGLDPSRFMDIFTQFYRAPANLVDVNIRWSNLLVDMWIPQRTFLGGWVVLLPALALVLDLPDSRSQRKDAIVLGVFAGGMPLVHTHSFLALGLFSAGYLLWHCFIRRTDRSRSRALLITCIIYLIITLSLALPQLFAFTFGQSSADGFVRFHFNWVNTNADGLKDSYLYFWIKNVGPPMLLILLMLFDLPAEHKPVACGAFLIFIAAELVEFQPNDYDNNKLFYVWYLMTLPCALAFGSRLFRRLKGIRARYVIAGAFVIVSVFSGVLSVIREGVSDYELYSANAVSMARYVEDNTPRDSVILTAANHNNPISAIAGRKVVCGPDVYLFFHGLNYQEKAADVTRFYTDPMRSQYVVEDNNVAYVLVGDYERAIPGLDEDTIGRMYTLVFEAGNYRLYKVGGSGSPVTPDDEPQG